MDTQQERPRVRCDASTFEEWEEKAEAYYDVMFHRGQRQRSMFDMFGQSIAMEIHIPWNVFKETSVVYKAMDFNIKKNSKTMVLAKTFNGEWEEGYYADEGYGWPVFAEAEDCWNFIRRYIGSGPNKAG
jgi:arginine/ornithine N-succinyltransferase beta subunit